MSKRAIAKAGLYVRPSVRPSVCPSLARLYGSRYRNTFTPYDEAMLLGFLTRTFAVMA